MRARYVPVIMLTSQLVVTKSGTKMLRIGFKRSKYVICRGMDLKTADNYVECSTIGGLMDVGQGDLPGWYFGFYAARGWRLSLKFECVFLLSTVLYSCSQV